MSEADLKVILKADDTQLKRAIQRAIKGGRDIQAAYKKSGASINDAVLARQNALKAQESTQKRLVAAQDAMSSAIERNNKATDRGYKVGMGRSKRQIALTDKLITQEKKRLSDIKQHIKAYDEIIKKQQTSYNVAKKAALSNQGGLAGLRRDLHDPAQTRGAATATQILTDKNNALKEVNKVLAKETANANAKLEKFNKSGKQTTKTVGMMNSKFARFSIYMSGIAATLFVIQQISAIARALVKPITDIEEAMININRLGSSSGFMPQQTISHNPMDDMGYYKGWETQYETLPNQINALKELRSFAESGMMKTEEASEKLIEYREAGYSAAQAINKLAGEIQTLQTEYEGTLSGEFKTFLGNMRGLSLLTFDNVGESFKKALEKINTALAKFTNTRQREIENVKKTGLASEWGDSSISGMVSHMQNIRDRAGVGSREQRAAERRRLGIGYNAIDINMPNDTGAAARTAADLAIINKEASDAYTNNLYKVVEEYHKAQPLLFGMNKEIKDSNKKFSKFIYALDYFGLSTAELSKAQYAAAQAIRAKYNFPGNTRYLTQRNQAAALGNFEDDYGDDSLAATLKWQASEQKTRDDERKKRDDERKKRVKGFIKAGKDTPNDPWMPEQAKKLADERAAAHSRGLGMMIEEEEKWSKRMTVLSQNTMEKMEDNFSSIFYDAVKGELKSFEDYARSIFDSISQAWADMMGQMLAQSIFGADGKGGGALDVGLDFLKSLVGGAGGSAGSGYTGPVAGTGMTWSPRASGGPVSPGTSYLVGERGPEILNMGNNSGHITPNHAMGGDTHITINVPINAVDAKDVQRMLTENKGLIGGLVGGEMMRSQGLRGQVKMAAR